MCCVFIRMEEVAASRRRATKQSMWWRMSSNLLLSHGRRGRSVESALNLCLIWSHRQNISLKMTHSEHGDKCLTHYILLVMPVYKMHISSRFKINFWCTMVNAYGAATRAYFIEK
ncbi:uncharacterized protein LOC131060011 [Cryptomeria japonica]|uniref:uncharacterized protein LOC131060011 n=1 Tax=Cryptomeria japonica TaxID=3369 RepID=UPI0025AC45ED|nr:uncharacterized protein LOC131060011 [Cryptomeria japonica]